MSRNKQRFILYFYRNRLDGKTYIGRTNNAAKRFKQHLTAEGTTDNNFFHTAIRELGVANNFDEFIKIFEIGIIYEETCNYEDRFEVSKRFDDLESQYIRDWNTLWPNGYNNKAYSKTKVFNLRPDQIEKQRQTYLANKDKHKKPRKSNLPIEFDTRLTKEEKGKIIRQNLKQFWESAKGKKRKEETQLTREQRNKERKEAYKQSEEYKQKHDAYIESCRQRAINYNKSEAHREVAIRSNQNRWKDGCPESTREKMRNSAGKAKGKIWVSKGLETKMIHKEELEKFIQQGYIKGRNFISHNKK